MTYDRSLDVAAKDAKLPNNLSAEAAIIGSVLYDNKAFERANDLVRPDDFYADAHREIWATIRGLITIGRQASGVSLREEFERSDKLKAIGGAEYLGDLLDSAAFGPEIDDYARIVHDLAQRRRLIESSFALQERSANPERGVDSVALLAGMRDDLTEIENAALTASQTLTDLGSAADRRFDAMTAQLQSGKPLPVGVSTGLDELDKQIARMHGGDLIILAGRPSMGKTSLATNIATNATVLDDEGNTQPAKVGFFSLEMSEHQIVDRASAQKARRHGIGTVVYQDIRAGRLGLNDIANLKAGRKHIPNTVMIETEANLSCDKIVARSKTMRRQMRGLDLIVIDYLQITADVLGSDRNRVNVVGQVTGRLKALAKDLGIPVICLSQLSRQVEQRDNKRPQLSDLRDSGSIEQDADVVIFVYRDEYYLSKSEPDWNANNWGEWNEKMVASRGIMEAIVPKNRMGPTGTVKLFIELKTDTVSQSPIENNGGML